MATILEQIASIDATIATKTAQISELRQSARDWRASKSECPGLKSSSKYKTCAQGKEDTALIRESNADAIQREINELLATKLTLKEAQKAENTIGIKLADQGISQAAALVESEGKAKAAIVSAQLKSSAEADAITKDAESSTFQKNMMIGFVGLVLLVASIVLIKKFAGKTKEKAKV